MAVGAAILLLVAAGCSSLSPKEALDRTAEEPTKDEVVEQLAWDPGDPLPAEDVVDIGGGPYVREPTLHLCGGDFPSEAHRVDGRSRTLFPKNDDDEVIISDPTRIEVVRYEPGFAQKALDELAMAAASCDPNEYTEVGTDEAHRTVIDPEDPALVEGLAPGSFGRTFLVIQQTSLAGEQGLEEMLIAQRRGDLLVVVEGHPVRTPVLAANAAERLAALDPADTGE